MTRYPDITATREANGEITMVPRSARGNAHLAEAFAWVGDRNLTDDECVAILWRAVERKLIVDIKA